MSAINVGQTDDGQTFLMLEVGTASLMFAVPQSTLTEVGQTLLALSARVTGQAVIAKPSWPSRRGRAVGAASKRAAGRPLGSQPVCDKAPLFKTAMCATTLYLRGYNATK